ncbi:MAG: flagellar hook-length control protein FliK [Lachnospiraceae bacterium]|nr:flagellar hook-length control protein FliK [Lachnospiraceae bacterium]
MQISDMLNQYNRNTATGATAVSPQQGVQQLVSAVRAMTVGNIFEGTVNSIRHGQVTLGLSNGQTIQARVEGNVSLSVGQSMFFQVKANEGNTIEIRPYINGNQDNPTLLKALDAAGIPAEPAAVDMVNAMMEEQMPIDRASIQNMARQIAGFEGADIKNLVQMSKLEIPLTPENIEQFTNYKQDQAAILGQFEGVLDSLTDVYGDKNMSADQLREISGRVWQVLRPETSELSAAEVGELAQEQEWSPGELTAAVSARFSEETSGYVQQASEAFGEETGVGNEPQTQTAALPTDSADELPRDEMQSAAGNREATVSIDRSAVMEGKPEQFSYEPHTVGAVMEEKDVQTLTRLIRDFGDDNPAKQILLTKGETLNRSLPAKEFLGQLHELLENGKPEHEETVRKLLSQRGYHKALRDVVEQEWTLKPQDVRADKLKNLYDRLNRQMEKMEQVLKETGQEHTPLAKAVSQVQGNVEFMNQINQTYQYIQIPLQMSGQNAQSELYVYTNKKNLSDPEGELSAFLHLDMDHLGATDVSVRMKNRKVHTDFYMEDDRSYALIREHLDELEQRLAEKGFQCSVNVENHGYKMDFVDDFLKRDQPAGGILHRYSFDVRA